MPSFPVPLHLGQVAASSRTETTPVPLQPRQVILPLSRPVPRQILQVTTGGVTVTLPTPLHTGHTLALPNLGSTPLPRQYPQLTESTNRFSGGRPTRPRLAFGSLIPVSSKISWAQCCFSSDIGSSFACRGRAERKWTCDGPARVPDVGGPLHLGIQGRPNRRKPLHWQFCGRTSDRCPLLSDHRSSSPSGPRLRLRSSSFSPNISLSSSMRASSFRKVWPSRSISSSLKEPASMRRSAWRSRS